MMRAVVCLGFAGLFVVVLMTLLSVGEVIGTISAWLLTPGYYLSFAGKWFGLDCPKSDSIQDKMTCAGMGLTADWFIYAATFYSVSFLFWHRKRKDELDVDHNIAGTTIGINN